MYVSSLRSYIEAVGGKLKIIAEFPEGEVAITNFSYVGEAEDALSNAGVGVALALWKIRYSHTRQKR